MSKPKLTTADRRKYREALFHLEARLSGHVSRLEAEALRPAGTAAGNPDEVPAHEADPATRVAEDAVAIALLGSEEYVLSETREALARLRAGTFGKCEKCGHAISHERLDAVPYARDCAPCARAHA